MLRRALFDIANERPIAYGDQPGGHTLRQTMIREHLPEIAAGLHEWDRIATRLVEAPGALRVTFERALDERGLSSPPYNRENLVQRLTEFTNERAVRGELDVPPNFELNHGSIWYSRALIAV
jgi:hypothetical protein